MDGDRGHLQRAAGEVGDPASAGERRDGAAGHFGWRVNSIYE